MAIAQTVRPLGQPQASGRPAAPWSQADLTGAILGGQVAGLAMMGALAIGFYFFSPLGLMSRPLQIIAAVFAGDVALEVPPGIGHLFVGLIAHQLGPTLFWSLVFGVLSSRLRTREQPARSMALGLAVGLAAFALDVLVLVPWVSRHLSGHDLWGENVRLSWSIGAHGVFGLALGTLAQHFCQSHRRGRMAQRGL